MSFFKKRPPQAAETAVVSAGPVQAPIRANTNGSAAIVDTLRATVSRISQDQLPVDQIDIRAHLLDSGYVDSLSSIELLADIERQFGVRIEEMQIVGKLSTIEALAREIEERTSRATP